MDMQQVQTVVGIDPYTLGTIELNELTGAEPLYKRHRNRPPHTPWQPIASTDERGDRSNIVIARMDDGSWARVSFRQASGGRGPDKAERAKDGYLGNKNSKRVQEVARIAQ